MTAISLKPRLTRLAIVAVAALSIAACSTASNPNAAKPSTSASSPSSAPKPPPPPPPPIGKDHVEGLVRSVSGNAIQLTQRDRSAATVDLTPQTMVTEIRSAALADVKPGSCVDVKATPQGTPPGGPITAESIEIGPAIGGRCPPPEEPGAPPAVYGTVASVADNTIAVDSTDPSGKATHTDVTVTPTTTYTEHPVTNTQAIQQGKCLAAQGTNTGGALQAATIDLQPCPPMGGPHHHFHLPRLPHFHHH